MLTHVSTLIVALLVSSQDTAPLPQTSQNVGRLFEAIKSHDAAAYTRLAPHLILMAAPDFGVPLTLELAQRTLGSCTPVAVDAPYKAQNPSKMMAPGDDALLVPATLECSTPTASKRVPVEFQVDDQEVYVIYPGGLKALLQSQRHNP